MLLSVSCGQQHQAKVVIQDFIDQYATNPSSFGSISISKFDSTRILNDSVINRMRANADTIKRYQKSITYANSAPGKKLYVTRINYFFDNEKYSDTYYLDENLTNIVAFKTNGIVENEEK